MRVTLNHHGLIRKKPCQVTAVGCCAVMASSRWRERGKECACLYQPDGHLLGGYPQLHSHTFLQLHRAVQGLDFCCSHNRSLT